jgi:glycosyltransferase involved in cell wall biosynthesis
LNQIKLSVIIPAHNEENYLSFCLASIIREKLRSGLFVEIIVVNNASTDKTKEVALSFPEVLVVDEPQKGITYARQAGFEKSSGNLIANIDADAILAPDWLDTVIKNFTQRPELIALSGPPVYYDLPLFSNILVRFYYYLSFVVYLINRFIFRVGSLLQGGNFVVKKSALKQIGGFDTSISFYGEDIDIARRLRALGPVVFTFKLPMYFSGRRLKSEGLLVMGIKYPINYFWTTFFKKPFHKNYTDVRLSGQKLPDFQTTLEKLRKTFLIGKIAAAILVVAGLLAVLFPYAPF